ncbi:MAG: hypothetical protein AB7O80_23225 [Acetobacteraceae bacterium]
MTQLQPIHAQAPTVFSPLMLSDQLIALAQAADGAGFVDTAEQLVTLAFSVLDPGPRRPD